jgi:7-cyano-7-deazaguanine synthase in queuosine biosynthesis
MTFPKAPEGGALVALISGGLDSLVVAAMAKEK